MSGSMSGDESAESAAQSPEPVEPPTPGGGSEGDGESEDWVAPDAVPQAVVEPATLALADQIPTTQTPTPMQTPTQTPLPQSTAPSDTTTQPAPAFPGQAQTYPQATAPGYPAGYAVQDGNPYAPAYAPTSDHPSGKRKRLWWILGAAVVVLGLVGAGVYALLPGRTGNSIVSAVDCRSTSANLATCLIKAPAGAVRLSAASGDDEWPQQTVSSADLYASNITVDSPAVGADTASLLSQDGVTTVVHTDWNAVDGDNVDLVLLAFSTRKGAQTWNSTRGAEILAAYPGPAVAVPGDSTSEAHAAVKADAHGNIDADYTTVVGRTVLEVAYSSPNKLSNQDLRNWAGTELASLRTAPVPAADPAPTAPGTEQVACGSGLQSCLMAVPDGGEPWQDPISSDWISGSSPTSTQFVRLFWSDQNASTRQQVLSNFTTDGVTGIAHEDWAVDNADEQADIYVVRTITATGAAQLAASNFGEPDWTGGLSGIAHTIPGTSNTQSWYSNKKDSNGFTDFYFTTTVGNVIVMGWLYFYGSFDSSLASSWAKPELARVDQSAHTVPMGLFSLATPALPAAAQGSCGASADCLLPLPSGASDTTSTSYEVNHGLDVTDYVDKYDGNLSADVTTWLGSDGFVSAEHRAWTASNGATADAVLLKYARPAQAQAAAMLEYGVNAPGERECSDAALPDSLCLAAPVSTTDPLQEETVRVLAWKGDYEVSVNVTISNSADLAQAYAWAEQQLDRLPAH